MNASSVTVDPGHSDTLSELAASLLAAEEEPASNIRRSMGRHLHGLVV